MERIAFVLKIAGNQANAVCDVSKSENLFKESCKRYSLYNFSLWHMEEYLFGYAESDEKIDTTCFDTAFASLPESVFVVCRPGTMRLMYHDIGIVRSDKNFIRHRVFATRIHPGCEEVYKRRHDELVIARGNTVKEGPESNFTIWYGDGCIFGYCELVRSFDAIVETPEAHQATIEWETRGLEIMDWITDDVDWLTGLKHNAVERVF